MTIREMITALEGLATQYGDDTRCTVYDDYTACEDGTLKKKTFIQTPRPTMTKKCKLQ